LNMDRLSITAKMAVGDHGPMMDPTSILSFCFSKGLRHILYLYFSLSVCSDHVMFGKGMGFITVMYIKLEDERREKSIKTKKKKKAGTDLWRSPAAIAAHLKPIFISKEEARREEFMSFFLLLLLNLKDETMA